MEPHAGYSAIKNQVRLPLSVAWGIVVQGFRIRLGRSLVTLTGVVLGVAFLMSILSADFIRHQVSGEIAMRQNVSAMLGFLVAETGPLAGRSLAVHFGGEPDAQEIRFLEALGREGVKDLVPANRLAGGTEEAAGLVVVGSDLPDEIWKPASGSLHQRIAAFTRSPKVVPAGVGAVLLQRPPTGEDIERQKAGAAKARARTIWIVSIAVLVTIISISNALLMSVTERFREIGTMKCLGALSSFIRRIFFLESALLGLVGSIFGSLFGLAFAIVLYAFTYGWVPVFCSLPIPGLLLSFFICTTGGVVASVLAAIYPAGFASRMVPATALRTNI